MQLRLRDGHNRVATNLRVSLTDRCNLRCLYCMPEAGLPWIPRQDLLTADEINRLIRIGVELLGIRKVRFTGGEPLLRPGLASIVAATAALDKSLEIALTTNGIGLDRKIRELTDAGLRRVNISLDSLDPARYAKLACRNRLEDVLRGVAAAHEAGISPVKINSVIMPNRNEADILPLAQFCLANGYELRFIEQMPLGPGGAWRRDRMVTAGQILGKLRERYRLAKAPDPRRESPAEIWQVEPDEHQPGGRIGIIASVTRPFCGSCDRTRLTCDGQILSCLFSRGGTDLRTLMRSGASDDVLAREWADTHRNKPGFHHLAEPGFAQPDRTMSAIGG